jgi:hypothetical protein
VFDPLQEQLEMLIEYIKILNRRPEEDQKDCIVFLLEMMNILKNWIEIYLNYQMRVEKYD